MLEEILINYIIFLNNKIEYVNKSTNNIVFVDEYSTIDDDSGDEKKKLSNIYITKDDERIYRWNDIEYIELNTDSNNIVYVDDYDILDNLNDKKINVIYVTKDDGKMYIWDLTSLNRVGNSIESNSGKHIINSLPNKTFLYFDSYIYTTIKK